MTEQQIKDSISDEDLRALAKSLLLYGNEGVIDEYFEEFCKFIEPLYNGDTLNAAISLITTEILNRYSKV